MIKFSKNLNDIKLIKKNFFSENNQLLLDKLKINRKYKNQKKRIFCKNCNKKIKNNKILNHVGTSTAYMRIPKVFLTGYISIKMETITNLAMLKIINKE